MSQVTIFFLTGVPDKRHSREMNRYSFNNEKILNEMKEGELSKLPALTASRHKSLSSPTILTAPGFRTLAKTVPDRTKLSYKKNHGWQIKKDHQRQRNQELGLEVWFRRPRQANANGPRSTETWRNLGNTKKKKKWQLTSRASDLSLKPKHPHIGLSFRKYKQYYLTPATYFQSVK